MGPKKYTLDELSSSLDAQLDGKLADFGAALIADIKKEIMGEVKQLLAHHESKIEQQETKITQLESHVAMLQKHVENVKCIQVDNESKYDDIEQYGRRLCLRIDGVETVENETADNVLDKVKAIVVESGAKIPDEFIDRAHRIGAPYEDRKTKVMAQSIIVRFCNFRHRTLFYRNRKNLSGKTVKLDLTRKRYTILSDARVLVEKNDNVDFVYSDINRHFPNFIKISC